MCSKNRRYTLFDSFVYRNGDSSNIYDFMPEKLKNKQRKMTTEVLFISLRISEIFPAEAV